MSSTLNPAIVPERDNLPLKKREQRGNSLPSTTQQQQYDTATFKAPYPYKSNNEARVKHTGPLQPVPKRVPALYQPWMHTYKSTRSKPQVLSAFREHHSWAAWRESYPLHLGSDLSHPFQHHWPATNALYYPSKFSPISPVDDGFQRTGGGYNWEQQLNKLRDKNSDTLWQSNERNRGPYVKRKERNVESFPNIKANCPSCPPHSQHEDPNNALCKPTTLVKRPISGHSCFREEKSCNTYTSISEDPSRSSPRASFENATVFAWSKKRRPWLLPHFVAGSLIELRDGRLRRVEHLQTEDFLLGSLACPDLRLSCCTVQSIAPSASSSSISRLLILLHDHQSQVKENTWFFLEIVVTKDNPQAFFVTTFINVLQ